MNVRFLVADEREAKFFDAPKFGVPLQAAGSLVNDTARARDRELETDRAGQRFNPANPGRHGMDGERSTHRQALADFARGVARTLEQGRIRNEFDRLVIFAGPRMLGLLREALPVPCRSLVAAEIPKDLVHEDEAVVRENVPRDVFFH